jgi:hypothetical protein
MCVDEYIHNWYHYPRKKHMDDQRQIWYTSRLCGLALMTLTWRHKRKGRKSPHDTQNLSQFMKNGSLCTNNYNSSARCPPHWCISWASQNKSPSKSRHSVCRWEVKGPSIQVGRAKASLILGNAHGHRHCTTVINHAPSFLSEENSHDTRRVSTWYLLGMNAKKDNGVYTKM